MNKHVIDTAVSILAKHIQTPPPPSNQINVLTTAIAIIQASINKPTITSGPITEQPTFYEGQLRRGPIEIAGTLAIADTSDPMNPPTETNIYSVDITPRYSDKPNDDPARPYSYTITPNIGGVIDRTGEINRLNDELQKQKEKIDDLTKQVKSTTATLSAPVVAGP